MIMMFIGRLNVFKVLQQNESYEMASKVNLDFNHELF